MKNEDIRKLKNIELELFKQFIQCCEKLSLTYYVLGGTMLGAVRHEGFIPWDDDIDVGMMRHDYEVFLKEAPKLLPDYYFLQSTESEPSYINNFAKLRDSRTAFIETAVKDYPINHGVYIDIFPLDYYPERKSDQRMFDLRFKLLSLRVRSAIVIPEGSKHSPIAELGAKVLSGIVSLRYRTAKDALQAMDRLCRSVAKSNLVANYYGAWGKKEIVPYSWYGNGVSGIFEGIQITLPSNYEKWLTQVYGDYMQLPPVEKRVTHHYTEVIDLENSYLKYTKE